MKPLCSGPDCDRPVLARGKCSRCYQRWRKYGDWEKSYDGWRPIVATKPQPIVFGSPLMPQRFWDNIEVTDAGCWRWTRAKRSGYGVMNIGGSVRALHLVTYEVFIGPRPKGLMADHLCHTNNPACWLGDKCPHRACCHPLCIEFVTNAENAARGRHWHARKTHCPRGHPYAPPHVQYDREGYPDCATCRKRKWRERYYRRTRQS
jgi:hypothetical protein